MKGNKNENLNWKLEINNFYHPPRNFSQEMRKETRQVANWKRHAIHFSVFQSSLEGKHLENLLCFLEKPS